MTTPEELLKMGKRHRSVDWTIPLLGAVHINDNGPIDPDRFFEVEKDGLCTQVYLGRWHVIFDRNPPTGNVTATTLVVILSLIMLFTGIS